MLVVVLAVARVEPAAGGIPERETTEVALALEVADDVLGLLRGHVALAAGGGRGEHAEVQLGVLALAGAADDIEPGIVVDGVRGLAAGIVVELDEEGVELGGLDELAHLEPLLGGRALRSGRDVVPGVQLAESVDEADPGLLVGVLVLYIDVETVDAEAVVGTVVEGARASVACAVRAEKVVQVIGELDTSRLILEIVGARAAAPALATDGEDNPLALALAVTDVLLDQVAVEEERSLRAVGLDVVDAGTAVTSKVCAGKAVAVLRGLVDEGECDGLDAGVVTVLAEAISGIPLTPVEVETAVGVGQDAGDGHGSGEKRLVHHLGKDIRSDKQYLSKKTVRWPRPVVNVVSMEDSTKGRKQNVCTAVWRGQAVSGWIGSNRVGEKREEEKEKGR